MFYKYLFKLHVNIFSVNCKFHSVWKSVHFTVYKVKCTMYEVHFILNVVQCAGKFTLYVE